MDKKEFIKEISPYFMFPHDDGEMENALSRGLDQLINSVKEDCAKMLEKESKSIKNHTDKQKLRTSGGMYVKGVKDGFLFSAKAIRDSK